MDAVTFIKERGRMCDSLFGCMGCPANSQENGYGDCNVSIGSKYPAEEQVKIVENWSKEHQPATRQSEFLKKYPNATLDSHGVLVISPCDLGFSREDCAFTACYICRDAFWKKPIE